MRANQQAGHAALLELTQAEQQRMTLHKHGFLPSSGPSTLSKHKTKFRTPFPKCRVVNSPFQGT